MLAIVLLLSPISCMAEFAGFLEPYKGLPQGLGRLVLLIAEDFLWEYGEENVLSAVSWEMLSLDENISEKDGNIGCAVFASPDDLAGFAKDGKDELLLLKVKSGTPVRYYVGTGWSKDLRFDPYRSKWPGIIKKTTYNTLNEIYN